ncbi:hypothetical protein J5N97_007838 [Dioscorea zingiberensis]|uniref:Uncharacterized protein n=1 Tax=Dioscorea zingiberensis TaxID=325984 RepID=A0A9D5DHD7_9LILI|nr:hypothetical protein J5N97_007838 [Dioscorea zingiberensis]
MEEMKAIACFPEALKISKTNGKNLILFLLVILIPINLLSMLAHHLLPPTLVIDLSPSQISQIPDYTPPINQATKFEVNFVYSLLNMISALAMIYFSAMACSGEKTTLEALFLKARRTWWRPTITLFYVMLFMSFPPAVLLLMLRVPGLIEKIVNFLGSSILIVMLLFSGFMVLWFLLLSFAQRWGLVSSILEEGLYGIEAIKRSLVFLRRRKLQVFLLFLLSLPQELAIFKVGTYMITDELIQIAWALPLYLLGRIYDSLVYTVFFCYNNY